MDSHANRVFISYRRDDAAGYAGRLEEALEKRLGRGSVFRDVLDIPPGEDFVHTIRARMAGAQTVLVLIGPRWAGGEAPGSRRIDNAGDFVRLEVAVALDSGARVVPVLLPGAVMPDEATLPVPLQPLARRNALNLSETHWEADLARLTQVVGPVGSGSARRWWLGSAAVAAAAGVVGALAWFKPWQPVDASDTLIGRWQAEVRYAWGDRYVERFEFSRLGGQLVGTATFLGYPRDMQMLQFEGNTLRFETRSQQSMGGQSGQTRQATHSYLAELRRKPPGQSLWLRMVTSGGFENNPPLEFEARRVAPAAGPAGSTASAAAHEARPKGQD